MWLLWLLTRKVNERVPAPAVESIADAASSAASGASGECGSLTEAVSATEREDDGCCAESAGDDANTGRSTCASRSCCDTSTAIDDSSGSPLCAAAAGEALNSGVSVAIRGGEGAGSDSESIDASEPVAVVGVIRCAAAAAVESAACGVVTSVLTNAGRLVRHFSEPVPTAVAAPSFGDAAPAAAPAVVAANEMVDDFDSAAPAGDGGTAASAAAREAPAGSFSTRELPPRSCEAVGAVANLRAPAATLLPVGEPSALLWLICEIGGADCSAADPRPPRVLGSGMSRTRSSVNDLSKWMSNQNIYNMKHSVQRDSRDGSH